MIVALARAEEPNLELVPHRAELFWVIGLAVLVLLVVVAVVAVVRSSRRGRESDLRDLAERAARAEAHADQLRERLAEARDEVERLHAHGDARGEPLAPGRVPDDPPGDEPAGTS